jgi:hypothetical protein
MKQIESKDILDNRGQTEDRGRKSFRMGYVVFVGVIILGVAAAYVGGQLIGEQVPANGVDIVGGNGDTLVTGGQKIEVIDAEEIPQNPPEVYGVFERREGNSIFIGTGTLTFTIVEGGVESEYDGPIYEVVVSHDTVIWEDVTFQALGTNEVPSGPVQQIIEPTTIEEIEEHGSSGQLIVWGEVRGDRVFASVITFHAQ